MNLLNNDRASSPPLTLRGLTAAMTAIAIAATEIAVAGPGESSAAAWVTAAALSAAAAVGALLPRRTRLIPALAMQAVLVALLLLPMAVECIRRQRTPAEVLLLCGMRNVAVGLAVFSGRRSCVRLAGVVTLFLTLFAASTGRGPVIVPLVIAYAGVGCLWLMSQYHEKISGTSGAPARFPAVTVTALVLLLSGCVAAAAMGPSNLAHAVAGFVPSSGGDKWANSSARSGIGDGDDLVTGAKDPKTSGFDAGSSFCESPRASLYDAFIENFGQGVKMKDLQKMFALNPKDINIIRHETAEDLRSGRQFSLQREPPKAQHPAVARSASSLFTVDAKGPLHLPMATYARLDGTQWAEEMLGPGRQLENLNDSNWIFVRLPESAIFIGEITRRIAIGTLGGDRLPLPPHLDRFRMGRVNRADFFAWAGASILRMAKRTVPHGSVIEAVSRQIDPQLLLAQAREWRPPGEWEECGPGTSPSPIDARILAMARRWVTGLPRGWGQIEAVAGHLRSEYTFDRSFRSSSPGGDGISEFLFETRRGPDYLFASAAVVLLRTLDYPARLASGFYVDPSLYDAASGQTPVQSGAAHFWAEVRLPGGSWVAVEPTPGFEPDAFVVPWVRLAAGAIAGWSRSHVAIELAAAVALLLAVIFRLDVRDGVVTSVWWLTARGDWRRRVLATLRLVERRSRLVRRPRPPAQSPGRWLLSGAASAARPDGLDHLAVLATWAAYAPADQRLAWDAAEAREVCWTVTRRWTRRRLGRVELQGRNRS